ncbi:hypothetical protein P4O66_012328 [Electrophorus voltai]|uniref:Albumin domain-containing protein n=1 Tax=Electrophorus voltai TaxID=2609070 RepID=A0AAD8Z6P6_9TELE|nr:hypothetical protein P4O66_012328 [Electrophorus voltai]
MRSRVLAIYSQKFPNGTFEEVSSVVNEFAKLAEDCCQNEADPDCFDKEPHLPDLAKVTFRISRLTGRAMSWRAVLVSCFSLLLADYPEFVKELIVVIDHPR